MVAGRHAAWSALVTACLAVASPAHALDWTPVVFDGDPAIGLPGELPMISADPVRWLDDDSLVYVGSALLASGAAGLWNWTPAQTELRAAFLPGQPPAFGAPVAFAANGAGDLAIVDTAGVHAPDGNGGTIPILAAGDPLPGGPDGLLFQGARIGAFPTAGPLVLTAMRRLAFGAWASDASFSIKFAALLVADPSGTVALVGLQGDPAPSAPNGFRFESFNWSAQAINDAGQLAFRARLVSDTAQADAIYRWDVVNGLELVALYVADGSPENVVVDAAPLDPPIIDALGGVAFLAGGLFVPDGEGGTERIFADGDPLAGQPTAVFRRPFFAYTTPNPPIANGADELAILYGYETTPYEPYGDGSAILVWSRDEGLRERLRTSDFWRSPYTGPYDLQLLDFSSTSEVATRVVIGRPCNCGEVYLLPAVGPRRRILDEDDLFPAAEGGTITTNPFAAPIAFDADFSQVSVSNSEGLYVATVPEPGAGLGAAIAISALVALRRRARAS